MIGYQDERQSFCTTRNTVTNWKFVLSAFCELSISYRFVTHTVSRIELIFRIGYKLLVESGDLAAPFADATPLNLICLVQSTIETAPQFTRSENPTWQACVYVLVLNHSLWPASSSGLHMLIADFKWNRFALVCNWHWMPYITELKFWAAEKFLQKKTLELKFVKICVSAW